MDKKHVAILAVVLICGIGAVGANQVINHTINLTAPTDQNISDNSSVNGSDSQDPANQTNPQGSDQVSNDQPTNGDNSGDSSTPSTTDNSDNNQAPTQTVNDNPHDCITQPEGTQTEVDPTVHGKVVE